MKQLYQKTFEQIKLPEDRAADLRASLASRCSQTKKEAIPMKHTKLFHRPAAAIAAVVLVVALSATAFAYSGGFYQFMTGGSVQNIVDEDGNITGTQAQVDLNQVTDPVEVREDGRLYLTIGGQDTDITGLCSYETPYIYECTGLDGLRHAFIIGGDLDALGWAEFFWNEDGIPQGGAAHFGTPEGSDDAPWLDAGKTQLNLPW